VYLGDQEVHPDRAEYKDLFEKLDEEIQEYVLDNAYEIWQDRMEGAADAAYDAWKESQYE
jgi:predicted house-cleaning noncanonical NTP pyrophosphatase (MazG superfamily)